jgi:hypothetical protein
MTSRTIERPRRQHDPEPRPAERAGREPRKFDLRAVEMTTQASGAHAGFDADLNPIDDEFINTHGSER